MYEWCWKETQEPNGWLSPAQVQRKRSEITAQMWRTEFDLQEPTAEGRAIDPDAWNGRSMLRLVKATPLRSSMGGRRCRADRRSSPARADDTLTGPTGHKQSTSRWW